jgi:hypothetical protein
MIFVFANGLSIGLDPRLTTEAITGQVVASNHDALWYKAQRAPLACLHAHSRRSPRINLMSRLPGWWYGKLVAVVRRF